MDFNESLNMAEFNEKMLKKDQLLNQKQDKSQADVYQVTETTMVIYVDIVSNKNCKQTGFRRVELELVKRISFENGIVEGFDHLCTDF